VEAVGRPGEALFLGDGQGVGQLVQLHASELIALNFMLFMSLTCRGPDPRVAEQSPDDVQRRGSALDDAAGAAATAGAAGTGPALRRCE
jgi:hypothetical protein